MQGVYSSGRLLMVSVTGVDETSCSLVAFPPIQQIWPLLELLYSRVNGSPLPQSDDLSKE